MSVTLVKRPLGIALQTTEQVVIIDNIPSIAVGKAIFLSTAHGLITGDYVYVKSTVINYNGFWYVDKFNDNAFFVREYSTASNIGYIKTVTGIYLIWSASHKWNCVHLPIVYKINNTLWPVNTEDSVRTVSSVTDSNSYCALVISAEIKTTGSAAALEFVKIITGSLVGVYQIVAYTNDLTFTIDIPYTAANDTALTGASIQYYYNSYGIKVNLYAGIIASHRFGFVKPFSLVSSLSFIPDSEGLIEFSVNELLKKNILIQNELLLGTLPNNTDFWTSFYIDYAESYDDSDGTTLSLLTTSYTSDLQTFVGYAVNTKLPFKNIYSGYLSEYILGSSFSNTKFLTLFDSPVIFQGYYFDVSFINDFFYFDFPNSELSTWVNDSLTGIAWTTGVNPTVTLNIAETSKRLYGVVPPIRNGKFYMVEFEILASFVATADIIVTWLDESLAVIGENTFIATFPGGADVVGFSLAGDSDARYISIRVVNTGGLSNTYTITDYVVLPFDTDFALISIVKNNIVQDVVVNGSGYNYGLFRAELNSVNCENETESLVIKRKRIIPLAPPFYWTDSGGGTDPFDSKGFDTLFENFNTSFVVTSAYLQLSETVLTGYIVEFNLVVTISGTAIFSGTILRVSLTDNSDVGQSNIASLPITSNGVFTFNVLLTTIGAATRLRVALSNNTIVSGTGNILIVFPGSYYQTDLSLTETLQLQVNCDCLKPNVTGVYLSWLNYLGGFDYWLFSAESEEQIDILNNGTAQKNLFTNWPKSYGEFADTIEKETFRMSKESQVIKSQILTEAQVEVIKYVKTSPLVQIVNSVYDRKTVLIDIDSFKVLNEGEKMHSISFRITNTDFIPSQN